ncbi:MAG: FoF1 ATP synthase subunit gamma [Holosporaceae bacterium]
MSTLQALLLRRSTIESTQKMMGAMKVVAATRLKKTQKAFDHTQTQQKKLLSLLADVVIDPNCGCLPLYARNVLAKPKSTHTRPGKTSALKAQQAKPLDAENWLKDAQPKGPLMWIVLGADKGLCGSFHTQLLRTAKAYKTLLTHPHSLLYVWGAKTAKMLEKNGFNVAFQQPVGRTSALERVQTTLQAAKTHPLKPALGFVWLHFRTALLQTPRVATLSDLLAPLFQNKNKPTLDEANVLVEPSVDLFLTHFFKLYTAQHILSLFLEASLSEEGARMAAMDNASRNSDDILKDITLLYNRTRQAMITRELIEVVSGANAL